MIYVSINIRTCIASVLVMGMDKHVALETMLDGSNSNVRKSYDCIYYTKIEEGFSQKTPVPKWKIDHCL